MFILVRSTKNTPAFDLSFQPFHVSALKSSLNPLVEEYYWNNRIWLFTCWWKLYFIHRCPGWNLVLFLLLSLLGLCVCVCVVLRSRPALTQSLKFPKCQASGASVGRTGQTGPPQFTGLKWSSARNQRDTFRALLGSRLRRIRPAKRNQHNMNVMLLMLCRTFNQSCPWVPKSSRTNVKIV